MRVSVRPLVVLIALAALCPLAFSLGQKQPATTTPTAPGQPVAPAAPSWKVGDNISITWYLNFPWWPYTGAWTDYPVLKQVSDVTGVVPSIVIPSGDPTEKLNLMIATGDLPDMISLELMNPITKKLVGEGLVFSFDDLIAQHIPAFKNEIPVDVWNYTRSAVDKKLYGLPSHFMPDWKWKEKVDTGFYTYNVYKEYFKAIGSPDMGTPTSYVAALIKFKAQFPKIGERSSIPVSLGPNVAYLQAFENSFGIKYYSEDASHALKIKYKDSQYVALAKFLNGLYRDGLLDPESFVKKNEQYNEDIASGRVFSAPSAWYYLPTAPASPDKPDGYFIVVEPMKTAGFTGFVLESRLGWTITMVSRKAKDPAAAIKFIRYMWNREGSLLMNYGRDGEHYTIVDNTIVRTPATAAEMKANAFEFQKKTGIWTFTMLFYPYVRVKNDDTPEVAASRALADKYGIDCTAYNYNVKPDPTSQAGIISTQVDDLVARELPKIIMADSEQKAVDALAEMNRKLDQVGLPQLERYWTTQYLKNRDVFAIND